MKRHVGKPGNLQLLFVTLNGRNNVGRVFVENDSNDAQALREALAACLVDMQVQTTQHVAPKKEKARYVPRRSDTYEALPSLRCRRLSHEL